MVRTNVNLDDWQFDVNAPGFLRESALDSKHGMYNVCYECFRVILSQVAQRATELNDPIMNVLMLRLNLYECKNNERREFMRMEIDRYNTLMNE